MFKLLEMICIHDFNLQKYLQDLGKISENGQKIKIEISDLSKYKETMWEMQQLIAMYERIINVHYFSSHRLKFIVLMSL